LAVSLPPDLNLRHSSPIWALLRCAVARLRYEPRLSITRDNRAYRVLCVSSWSVERGPFHRVSFGDRGTGLRHI